MITMEGSRKKIRLDDNTDGEHSTNDNPTSEILNDDCLLQVFEYLPISDRIRLERVNKRWCAVSKKSWQRCKNLTFTNDLWGCQNDAKVTKKALEKVLGYCGKYLNVLDMSATPVLAEKVDISSLVKLCPNLTSADFTSVKVGVPLIKSLVKHCKNIVELSIWQATRGITGQLINNTVLKTYTNLEVLQLGGIRSFEDLNNLNNFNSMKELNLEYCSVRICNLAKILPQLQNLHTLSLRGSDNICKSLADLDFTKLPNLKNLDISHNYWCLDDGFLIKIASSCTSLTSLYVGDNLNVTDEGLRAMASSSNIEFLSIDSARDTSRITGSSLSNLPFLKKLSCRYCNNLDRQYFKYLFDTSDNLEVIDLRGVRKRRVNAIIRLAMESVKSRKNDITLRMIVDSTNIDVTDLPDNLEVVEQEINIMIWYGRAGFDVACRYCRFTE